MPHHYSWRVGEEREDNDKICLHSNPLSLARSPSVSVIMLRLRVIVYCFGDGIDLPELTSIQMGEDAFAFIKDDSSLVIQSKVKAFFF